LTDAEAVRRALSISVDGEAMVILYDHIKFLIKYYRLKNQKTWCLYGVICFSKVYVITMFGLLTKV
jgi:hypothetical protein